MRQAKAPCDLQSSYQEVLSRQRMFESNLYVRQYPNHNHRVGRRRFALVCLHQDTQLSLHRSLYLMVLLSRSQSQDRRHQS